MNFWNMGIPITMLSIAVLALTDVARAGDFEVIQKALAAIKKDICEMTAVSRSFSPPVSGVDRFSRSIKADDDTFKKECLAATSTDLIDIAASRRAGSCRELCDEQVNWSDAIRSDCRSACRGTSDGITLRLMYFKKGTDSVMEAGCSTDKQPPTRAGRTSP